MKLNGILRVYRFRRLHSDEGMHEVRNFQLQVPYSIQKKKNFKYLKKVKCSIPTGHWVRTRESKANTLKCLNFL